MTGADFPCGFAEQDGQPLKRIMFDLEHGKIFDAGMRHYGEFYANLTYARELLDRDTVHVDGIPGSVSVVHRFANAIQLKWRPACG